MSQPIYWVHAEDLPRSTRAVLAMYCYRLHVMGSDDELLPASSVTVVVHLPSCCAPSRSASAPLLPAKYFPSFRVSFYIRSIIYRTEVKVTAQ